MSSGWPAMRFTPVTAGAPPAFTLQTYFDEKTWYRQTYTPEEFDGLINQLNVTEQANADAISAIEGSRGSPHL